MSFQISVVLGAVLAALFVLFARFVGGRRENVPLAVGLVVAALVYVGFEVRSITGSLQWGLDGLVTEAVGLVLFAALAVAGLRVSPWFLAFGWAAHVLWDVLLHPPPTSDYVPVWYPTLCIGFDLVVAGYVALRATRPAPAAAD